MSGAIEANEAVYRINDVVGTHRAIAKIREHEIAELAAEIERRDRSFRQHAYRTPAEYRQIAEIELDKIARKQHRPSLGERLGDTMTILVGIVVIVALAALYASVMML